MLLLPLLTMMACLPVADTVQEIRRYQFTSEDAGKLPATWERAQTGEGQGSVWVVTKDPSTPSGTGYVLAQTAKGPNQLYNLATLKESSFLNGTLTIRLKAIAGELDQGGGIVWRYQDARNYYIARYNPLESNFRLYHVLDGKRTQLATEEKLSFPSVTWHTVSITHDADNIICSLNGKEILKAKDKSITQAGRVGFWTKADAQTHFDGIEIKGIGKK